MKRNVSSSTVCCPGPKLKKLSLDRGAWVANSKQKYNLSSHRVQATQGTGVKFKTGEKSFNYRSFHLQTL